MDDPSPQAAARDVGWVGLLLPTRSAMHANPLRVLVIMKIFLFLFLFFSWFVIHDFFSDRSFITSGITSRMMARNQPSQVGTPGLNSKQ